MMENNPDYQSRHFTPMAKLVYRSDADVARARRYFRMLGHARIDAVMRQRDTGMGGKS